MSDAIKSHFVVMISHDEFSHKSLTKFMMYTVFEICLFLGSNSWKHHQERIMHKICATYVLVKIGFLPIDLNWRF